MNEAIQRIKQDWEQDQRDWAKERLRLESRLDHQDRLEKLIWFCGAVVFTGVIFSIVLDFF